MVRRTDTSDGIPTFLKTFTTYLELISETFWPFKVKNASISLAGDAVNVDVLHSRKSGWIIPSMMIVSSIGILVRIGGRLATSKNKKKTSTIWKIREA